jgi:hypothetical protein
MANAAAAVVNVGASAAIVWWRRGFSEQRRHPSKSSRPFTRRRGGILLPLGSEHPHGLDI